VIYKLIKYIKQIIKDSIKEIHEYKDIEKKQRLNKEE